MSDLVRNFSAWASSAMEAVKEMKFGTKVAIGDEDDARTLHTCIAQRKCAIPHLMMKNMTCVTVSDIQWTEI